MATYLGRDSEDGRPIIQPSDADTPAELQDFAESVGVWKSVTVDEAPSMIVTHWVLLTQPEHDPAILLASYWPAGREGRLSTPIALLDREQMRVQTESGRIYELHGGPATTLHPDTVWVLDVFCHRFSIDSTTLVDVTDTIFPKWAGKE